jgi:2-hydroxy-3-keto-5-methylthiopentenyl-1-phosphate phosphatase
MKKIAVLCDFDGTVADEDVGNLLFRSFTADGASGEIVELWKSGLISSRECLEKECALASVSREEIDRFIQARKLDLYFKDFHDFARNRGIEIVILSDGLDYYIEKMLLRHGVAEIDFFANKLTVINHSLLVEFPHYNMLDCTDCGNCKRFHLERYKRAGYYIVYVGNGFSDRCPSEYADLVFAKGALLSHCRKNKIKHVRFNNFRDVEREVLKRFVIFDAAKDEQLGG